jgi:hypothetical protein
MGGVENKKSKVPEFSMAGTTSLHPTPLGITPQKSPNQWVKKLGNAP